MPPTRNLRRRVCSPAHSPPEPARLLRSRTPAISPLSTTVTPRHIPVSVARPDPVTPIRGAQDPARPVHFTELLDAKEYARFCRDAAALHWSPMSILPPSPVAFTEHARR